MAILNSGIEVIVEWHKFKVGSSFYIPTLDPRGVISAVRKEAKARGITIHGMKVAEGKTIGVRIWRINDAERECDVGFGDDGDEF